MTFNIIVYNIAYEKFSDIFDQPRTLSIFECYGIGHDKECYNLIASNPSGHAYLSHLNLHYDAIRVLRPDFKSLWQNRELYNNTWHVF